MHVEAKHAPAALVITVLESRLDAKGAVEFKTMVTEWINRGYRVIVLNLAAVRFMDSSGLGAIVSTLKVLGRDGNLVLCGVTDPVMNLFTLTRMDRVFQMFTSESEALAALA